MKKINKLDCKMLLSFFGETEEAIETMISFFDEGWAVKCRISALFKTVVFKCERKGKILEIKFRY